MDTVARALELAQSGSFQAIKDLRAALKVEGMMQVDAHLAGAAFRKQLKVLMDAASRTTG